MWPALNVGEMKIEEIRAKRLRRMIYDEDVKVMYAKKVAVIWVYS